MIIKSLRHSQADSRYSLNYLFSGISDDLENRWLIFHNLTEGHDKKSIIREFNANAELLNKHHNRKRTFRYHEVLAFSYENSKRLNRYNLQQIAHAYLKLRDPEQRAQAICVPHIEKNGHYHLHYLLTSNFIDSNRSSDMMMNNEQYYEIRREMERYILRTHPELHRDTLFLPNEEIEKLLPQKYLSERRLNQLEKPTKQRNTAKEKVAELIKEILKKSNSLEEFKQLVNAQLELQTYERAGKLTGIIQTKEKSKKKYRFKTLGIDLLEENFLALKRMQEVEEIDRTKSLDRSNELER